jgi:hypothetical protein
MNGSSRQPSARFAFIGGLNAALMVEAEVRRQKTRHFLLPAVAAGCTGTKKATPFFGASRGKAKTGATGTGLPV